jgi:hypothetical protein
MVQELETRRFKAMDKLTSTCTDSPTMVFSSKIVSSEESMRTAGSGVMASATVLVASLSVSRTVEVQVELKAKF